MSDGVEVTRDVSREDVIRIVPWAAPYIEGPRNQYLRISKEERSVPLHASPASGEALVTNGSLGVDLIRVPAGKGFEPHTHPGDHILIVVGGQGTITYDGYVIPTFAGEVYMVDGLIPHGVTAITDHVILAVGSPHKPVDAEDRMAPVEYEAVASELGTVTCLVCGRVGNPLHDTGCRHCPCSVCAAGGYDVRPPAEDLQD